MTAPKLDLSLYVTDDDRSEFIRGAIAAADGDLDRVPLIWTRYAKERDAMFVAEVERITEAARAHIRRAAALEAEHDAAAESARTAQERVQRLTESVETERAKKTGALEIAVRSGQVDGAHHKAWAIDQMVRVLTACPTDRERDGRLVVVAVSEEYKALISGAITDGGEFPLYDWSTGVAP